MLGSIGLAFAHYLLCLTLHCEQPTRQLFLAVARQKPMDVACALASKADVNVADVR